MSSFFRQQGIPKESFRCVDNLGALLLYSKNDKIPETYFVDLCTKLEKHESVEFACTKKQEAKLGKLGLSPQAHPDTFPDIVIGLNHGWLLDTDKNRATKGSHGYFPETHPRMDGFMIRAGSSFPEGAHEELGHICDLYGIVEKLLNA